MATTLRFETPLPSQQECLTLSVSHRCYRNSLSTWNSRQRPSSPSLSSCHHRQLLEKEFRQLHCRRPHRLPSRYLTVSSVAVDIVDVDQASKDSLESKVELLACPICYQPLLRKGPVGINQAAISRSGFQCVRCKKAYSSRDVFLDLTVTAGAKEYEEFLPNGTELFRSPFVSFLYERGWRQNFARSGFPGPDEEIKLAQEFLQPTEGGVLVDVSCGSGLFSRRFAKSRAYSAVIALDFSENMLRQCSEFIKQDRSVQEQNLALVRADVARLPFATATVDAVHAGAALHCWPSPSAGVADISRILRPGGVFVATTFIDPTSYFQLDVLKPVQQALRRRMSSSSLRYWLEAELEDLCKSCGFTDYKKIRRGNFIMLSATKPQS